MAAVTANVIGTCVGSAVSLPSTRRPIASFNGLKAVPVLRQRAVISRPLSHRGMNIRAVADEQTVTKVRTLIAKQLGVAAEKVTPDSTFVALGADSLDTVEIMMGIEDEFDVHLDEDGDEGAAKITTVQEAADMIHAKTLAAKATA